MVGASFHRFLPPVSADKYIGSKRDPLFQQNYGNLYAEDSVSHTLHKQPLTETVEAPQCVLRLFPSMKIYVNLRE